MNFILSLKFWWMLVPLFWLVTLVGVYFDLDVAKLNLLCGILLLFGGNITRINSLKLKYFGIIALLFIFLSYTVSAHDYGVYIFTFACAFIYLFTYQNVPYNAIYLVIALGAFSNLSFITNTTFQVVQYDFLSCYNYIEYIIENNLMFWHENPLLTRPGYSSYHPILHYLLAAMAIMGGEAIGATRTAANEAMQIIVVGYMLWYYVLSARILKLLDLPLPIMVALLCFICLFPTYNAISGFINNDCLLLPLQAGAIYYTLLYYFNGGRKNLWYVWGFLTAACLTKLSGILLLPMIGVVLFLRLLQEKKHSTLYEQWIFALAVLCGILIWPLYQHYFLQVSATFVPPQEHLSLENFSFWQRFSPLKAFIYEQMFYDDYGPNLWETLTKTALFGQWNFTGRGMSIMWLILMLILNYKLINVMMIIAVIYLLFKNKDKKMVFIVLTLLMSLIGGLIAFSLFHPFMCNQDFRYIAILPLSYALVLGLFIPMLPKLWRWITMGLLIHFGLLSCFVWFFVSI